MNHLHSILMWVTGFCTLLYGAKLVLMLLGGDGADEVGGDLEAQAGDGIDPSFKLVTTQTLLAFGMGFGWLTLALVKQMGMSYPRAMGLGAINGLLLMALTGTILHALRRLNSPPRRTQPQAGDRGRAYTRLGERAGALGLVQLFDPHTQQARQYPGLAEGAGVIAAHTEVEVVNVMGDAVVVRAIAPLNQRGDVTCGI